MIEYKELSWRYWFLTSILLTAVIAGYQIGYFLAIWLMLIQLMHFIIRENNVTAMSVQVRFWFLILLLLVLAGPLQILVWVPAAITWLELLFGYCTISRCISLLPWNRDEAFSKDLVKKVFTSRPVRSKIMQEASTQRFNS